MPIKKLAFRPGVTRDITNLASEGGWWDMDKVRFRAGAPENMGGWQELLSGTLIGTVLGMFSWTSVAGDNYLSAGSDKKYYLLYQDVANDITPVRSSSTINTDPFTTGAAASTTVTVTDTAHGANPGDYVTYSGTTGPIDGIPADEFNAEHVITSVTDADTYTIEVTTGCTTGSVSGGGASVVAAYQINIGLAYTVAGVGWGAGAWASGGWGEAATDTSVASQLRVWTHANFGEDLLFCDRLGQIYYWDKTSGESTRAILLTAVGGATDVPTVANGVLVTDERHIVAWGTNFEGEATQDQMLVRWGDAESLGVWNELETNSSGWYRLSIGSSILAGKPMKQENLLWTDSALYSMHYVGAPYVFGFNLLESNISLISPNGVAISGNVAYWMGKNKFYRYDGNVSTLPCPISSLIFDDFNYDQSWLVTGGTNERFGEIIWLYCSDGAITPDKYVIFNHIDNIWYFGTIARSTWLDAPLMGGPVAANVADSKIYLHETGQGDGESNPPAAITSYIESADMDIEDGEHFSFVKRVLPDISFSGSELGSATVDLTVKVRDFPGNDFADSDTGGVTRTATSPVDEFTETVWVRLRGRQIAFRIECTTAGVKWRMGAPRIEIQPDGRR
jgi:hypothetical protein